MKRMLTAAAALLSFAAHAELACSWNAPGADRYTGEVPAAVDHYQDIPKAVRERLKARMAARQYDKVVTVTKTGISGGFGPAIRDMHFGSKGRVCATVDRTSWAWDAKERGLVYCEGEHCVIVPTVCGNVARVFREVPLAALPPVVSKREEPAAELPAVGGGGAVSSTMPTQVAYAAPVTTAQPTTINQTFHYPPEEVYYTPPVTLVDVTVIRDHVRVPGPIGGVCRPGFLARHGVLR